MPTDADDRLFADDVLTKRERVERTLLHRPVDRVALHDQVSYNPGVVACYTGRPVQGFAYTYDDVCTVIRKTLDACFPPVAPRGTGRITTPDGFVIQHDNWTSWTVSRPFSDVAGAREWVLRATESIRRRSRDAEAARPAFREQIQALQSKVGGTVIIDTGSQVGLCSCWSQVGLALFAYLYEDDPECVSEFIEAETDYQVWRAGAIGDPELSPVILIADDFATKRGPIFSPGFLQAEHFPRLQRLVEAWHGAGLKVLYHSDGNWKAVIPQLVECGVDGFYCLEPAVGMDIVQLAGEWPGHVWAGGVDGVDLMERGEPERVRAEVRRQIQQTDALHRSGVFIGTSSEINPQVKADNYVAMVEAVGELRNTRLR